MAHVGVVDGPGEFHLEGHYGAVVTLQEQVDLMIPAASAQVVGPCLANGAGGTHGERGEGLEEPAEQPCAAACPGEQGLF